MNKSTKRRQKLSPLLIVGQRDSEAEEVDKGEGTP